MKLYIIVISPWLENEYRFEGIVIGNAKCIDLEGNNVEMYIIKLTTPLSINGQAMDTFYCKCKDNSDLTFDKKALCEFITINHSAIKQQNDRIDLRGWRGGGMVTAEVQIINDIH